MFMKVSGDVCRKRHEMFCECMVRYVYILLKTPCHEEPPFHYRKIFSHLNVQYSRLPLKIKF